MSSVIVTGAAGGIGRATVKKLVGEGFHVVGCDIDIQGLESLQSNYNSSQFKCHPLDICDYEMVSKLFTELQDLEIVGLVNNGGIFLAKPFSRYTEEETDLVLATNVKSVLYFSQEYFNYCSLKNSRGTIVNIASVAAFEGGSDIVYAASKAAVVGITKSTAKAYSPLVRVNALAPALVDTALLKHMKNESRNNYLSEGLIPEMITPEDVANSIEFLLSRRATHYTGAIFDLNNGHYLR